MHRSLTSLTIVVAAVLLVDVGVAKAADPTTADCLAASDASLKRGNEHKLRSERAQLLVCAAASCPADIRKECVSRVDELNAQIPTIIFAAKDASGSDLSAVKVTMDGEVLAERVEGTALSIDPGEHMFLFETAGESAVTKTLVIRQGEKDRREAVAFGTMTTTPSITPLATQPNAPPAPTSAASSPELPATASGHGLGTQKILALVAGGLGIVGLGVGSAFGVMAVSQKSDAQNACPGTQCPTQDGVNKWSNAGTTGDISTIGLILGGVAIAGAAVLWFTSPSSSGATTQVGFGPGTLQVKGTW